MQKQSFMRADEVAQELGISKSHAYKVIHGLNEELQEKGYLTISGRVNREFFREKYYYTKTAKEESYLLLSVAGIAPRVILFTLLGDTIYDYIPMKLIITLILIAVPAAAVAILARVLYRRKISAKGERIRND